MKSVKAMTAESCPKGDGFDDENDEDGCFCNDLHFHWLCVPSEHFAVFVTRRVSDHLQRVR